MSAFAVLLTIGAVFFALAVVILVWLIRLEDAAQRDD